jgi:hypothetical protein
MRHGLKTSRQSHAWQRYRHGPPGGYFKTGESLFASRVPLPNEQELPENMGYCQGDGVKIL